MRFSSPQGDPLAVSGRAEAFELLKAYVGTSLAFGILLGRQLSFSPAQAAAIAALTAGSGFVLHELAHRVVARAFGAQARFWANNLMLLVAIVGAFAGFLFAAPGAVWHTGLLTKRQSGLVAAAGPVANMGLALLFLVASYLAVQQEAPVILVLGLRAGFQINAWLGFFNMLPLGPIDGAKVLNWSVVAFTLLLAAGALLAFYDRLEPYLTQWLMTH